MKKIRRSPVVTGLLFLLAVVLLFAGSVGGTQAALQIFSDDYISAFDLKHIGITLYENGTPVSFRNYGETAAAGFSEQQDGDLVLKNLEDDPSFQIGRKYPFVITCRNTGSIDHYLRVTIHKYWVKVGENEELTYYYIGILPVDAETAPLFDTLWIDSSVAKKADVKVETVGSKTVTTYTYAYNGYGFVVQAETDAVQTHHARAAIRSAWGLQSDAMASQMNIPAE